MTLRFLDPAFDVIFVVAHDNKAGVAELFEMRKRRVSELVHSKSGKVLWLFDDFAETYCQASLFSETQQS
jgi:hypothetical protein